MNNKHNQNDWHLLADRFVWYDTEALTRIPREVSDEEIQKYLYVYHGDDISLEEVKQWRILKANHTIPLSNK